MADEIIITPSPAIEITISPTITPTTPASEVVVYGGPVGPAGPAGPAGPTGPTGPTGPAGQAGQDGQDGVTPVIAYTHTQNLVSSNWSITHNLGFRPNVTTIDSASMNIEGTVQHVSENSLNINFSIASSGTAYLS